MHSIVKINNLSVTLGGTVEALRDVNLELPAGKTVAFIGPSGAGKTTLIRSIVGRLKTSEGAVEVLGEPAGSPSLRQRVTYMTQELSVYNDLTVAENLVYFGQMAGQKPAEARRSAGHILETVDLVPQAGQLVSTLSGGQKQRVSLAVALVGSPQLMVLDEPTVGLDPVLRDRLWQLFRQFANQGTSLIISSHSMDEARRCDDLVLIRRGRIIAHDTPHGLLQSTHASSVEEAFLKLVGDSAEGGDE